MLFVLKEIDGIFRSLLSLGPIADDTASTCHHLQKTPKWKKILPLAKSYLGNSLHLLSNTTDPVLIAFILRCVRYSMPMLGACDRLQKKFIKV